MPDFTPFESLEAVNEAHGAKTETGQRRYEVDHRWRAHLESERVRLMSGAPTKPAEPAPSMAGVTATDELGRRAFVAGSPDPRMLELCERLAARMGPDGRRMVDTVPGYREQVEASFLEAMTGKPWSPDAAALADELAAEAAAHAADSGLYPGAESQGPLQLDRLDPLFQEAAKTAEAAGLTDKQFATVLNFVANQGLIR